MHMLSLLQLLFSPQTLLGEACRHQTEQLQCRLLGLEPEVQTFIFDFYQAILEATIAQARREGRYDDGIVDVAGTAISLAEAPKVCAEFHPEAEN